MDIGTIVVGSLFLLMAGVALRETVRAETPDGKANGHMAAGFVCACSFAFVALAILGLLP